MALVLYDGRHMPLQMFPVRTFPHGTLLLCPALNVVAWAEARTIATTAGAAMEKFEQWLLGHFEMAFSPSITDNEALAKYVDRPASTFSTSRLMASLRLAEERLPGALEDWGWGGREVRFGVGAMHAQTSVGHYVTAGDPIDCWHARVDHRQWISRRSDAPEPAEGGTSLEPREWRLDLEEGDVFGLGSWHDVPASVSVGRSGDFGDFLAGIVASSAASGTPQGVVCRWRRG